MFPCDKRNMQRVAWEEGAVWLVYWPLYFGRFCDARKLFVRAGERASESTCVSV